MQTVADVCSAGESASDAKPRLRIALLIPEWPGQTHIFFWREIRALRELGIEPHVISTRRPPANVICHEWSQQAIQQCIYLMPLSVIGLLDGLWQLIRRGPTRLIRSCEVILMARDATPTEKLKSLTLLPFAGRLLGILRRNQYTHLHAHSCGNAAMLALIAHLLDDVDYSLTLHSALATFGGHQKAKWQHARFGTTVTEQLKQELFQHCGNLDPDKVDVAPMGVDLQVFQRDRPYQPPAAGETWRLVSCGRLHHGKGHQDVIRAVAMIRDAGQPVHLTILGEGPERENLQRLIDELDADAMVTLAGSVSEIQVRDHLARSHLFVLGSHEEAIGVATMEAMAMGLPVVVTDVGGVRELVHDGDHGKLVPARSIQVIAREVERILSDPPLARQFGNTGQCRIHEQFSSCRSALTLSKRIQEIKTVVKASHA
jgi:colanic acid/amylovoran biosynthesis glycosyltransferase